MHYKSGKRAVVFERSTILSVDVFLKIAFNVLASIKYINCLSSTYVHKHVIYIYQYKYQTDVYIDWWFLRTH